MFIASTSGPLIHVKEMYMGTVLYFYDLHGPSRPLHGPPVKNLCARGSWSVQHSVPRIVILVSAHACAIARELTRATILVHAHAGIHASPSKSPSNFSKIKS